MDFTRHTDRLISKALLRAVAIVLLLAMVQSPTWARTMAKHQQKLSKYRLARRKILNQRASEFRSKFLREKKAAKLWAHVHSRKLRIQSRSRTIELMAIRNGKPIYYSTQNENAAISTAADLVRNEPYNSDGSGLTVGVWDAGSVLASHQEFGSRVTIKDGALSNYHSTHVGGTIGASGVVAGAKGMAPNVDIDSYDWNDDVAEMADAAMSFAGEAGKIQVSNHSYGTTSGWSEDNGEWTWYGTWGDRESDNFGQYDEDARSWDQVCYDAPYWLPFKSAGNDRNDGTPEEGESFTYYDNGWKTKNYDSSSDPYADSWDHGGFDTIATSACAKNIMTVGAVNDAVNGGVRNLGQATMTTFSCYGPTDDGRVKPDIVANGSSLYSCDNGNNADYRWMSGTSTSSPNAAGSAVLLVDYYGQINPGSYMRASTLKCLIIHTADDLGNVGPDYKFGWGLMNTRAAADAIAQDRTKEGLLTDTITHLSYDISCDGLSPLKVTICWTDPAATALTGLDNPAPRLVNDLDLRVTSPDGSVVYMPYVLDPANPTLAATKGDNVLDNVEQVYIDAPEAGVYRVEVSYKGSLVNSQQYFSLVSDAPFTTYPPVANDVEVETVFNNPVTIALDASDDGYPKNPGSLSYVITSLTNHGTLSDPAGGVIDSVPYTLLNGGNEVIFTPRNGCALDANFTFKAFDGGISPDGGYSNEALVSVAINLDVVLLAKETFDNGLPADWTVIDGFSDSKSWRDDNPNNRDAIGGISEPFMIVDSDWANRVDLDEELISKSFDCSQARNVTLSFNNDFKHYSDEIGDVDIRVNGGSWQNIARYSGTDTSGLVNIDISAIADGESNVELRWHYYNANYEWWWAIDNIEVRGLGVIEHLKGDIDNDCDVDFDDLLTFARSWLQHCDGCAADITGDGLVDLVDFSYIAGDWLLDSLQ